MNRKYQIFVKYMYTYIYTSIYTLYKHIIYTHTHEYIYTHINRHTAWYKDTYIHITVCMYVVQVWRVVVVAASSWEGSEKWPTCWSPDTRPPALTPPPRTLLHPRPSPLSPSSRRPPRRPHWPPSPCPPHPPLHPRGEDGSWHPQPKLGMSLQSLSLALNPIVQ